MREALDYFESVPDTSKAWVARVEEHKDIEIEENFKHFGHNIAKILSNFVNVARTNSQDALTIELKKKDNDNDLVKALCSYININVMLRAGLEGVLGIVNQEVLDMTDKLTDLPDEVMSEGLNGIKEEDVKKIRGALLKECKNIMDSGIHHKAEELTGQTNNNSPLVKVITPGSKEEAILNMLFGKKDD